MIISRVSPALTFQASGRPRAAASREEEAPRDSVTLQATASPAVEPLTVASSMAPGLFPLGKLLEDLELQGAEFRTRRRWIPIFKVHRELSAPQAARLLEKRPEALQVRLGAPDWTPLEGPEEVGTLAALRRVIPAPSPLVEGLASLEAPLDTYRALSRGDSVRLGSWNLRDAEDVCLAAYLKGDVSAGSLLERPRDAELVKALADLELHLGANELDGYRLLAAQEPLTVSSDGVPLLTFTEPSPDLCAQAAKRKRFLDELACERKADTMRWLVESEDFAGWGAAVRGLVARGVRDPLAVCQGLEEPAVDTLPAELDDELVSLAVPLAGERFTASALTAVYDRLAGADLTPAERRSLSRSQAPSSVVFDLLGAGEERDKLLRGLAAMGPSSRRLEGLAPEQRREELLLHVGLEGADQDLRADLSARLLELTGFEPEVNLDEGCQLNGRIATVEEVETLARRLRQEDEIPFDYIYDGCYARAHLMCRELGAMGVSRAKLFVHGDLAASNQYQSVSWGWHVAPLVFVAGEDGRPEARILDPSFTTELLTPEEWIARFWRSGSVRTEIVVETQYMERPAYGPSADMDQDMPEVESVMTSYAEVLNTMRKSA